MAVELTEMGYDVEYTGTSYNESILVEMAVNEGYKWNDEKEKWE